MVIKENINTVKDVDRKVYKFFMFVGSFGGLLGGMLLLLAGLFLSTEIFVTKINFHGLEVVLLVLAFFFLSIGAHCLDLMDKESKAKRNL